ncbi:hypothetical protein PENSPDRAFT_688540 [Peniophora sp. CONT]|nr:hypothetical protein PENSPDRAFT_688540 [Peniophora sp. CONT]
MFARVFTLAALAVMAVAQLTINTPSARGATTANQCEIYQITWTGGTGPFDIRLLDGTQNIIEEIAGAAASSPIQWTINQPANQTFFFSIHDSTGAAAISSQFTIQTPVNSACLSASNSSNTANEPAGSTAEPTTSADTPFFSNGSSAESTTSRTSALSADAIAGIAVGAACGVLFVVMGAVWVMRRSRRRASVAFEASSVATTSVEPFPLSRPEMQQSGPFGARNSLPAGWETKNRQDDRPGTTERTVTTTLEDTARPVLSQTYSSETPSPEELSETALDRLVNQVVRRLQAQEAPPSYPASSHPDSDD